MEHAESAPHPAAAGDLWVFGYGSLMWNPGFEFVDRLPAVLHGFHRSFCVRSTIYRGTPDQPGLVLGIDAGGECHGIAYRVAAEHRGRTIAYLYARELPSHVYTPTWVNVVIGDGTVEALTFVVRRDHEKFVHLHGEKAAEIIARAAGAYGSNAEYLDRTIRELHALGVPDPDLDALCEHVRQLLGPAARASGCEGIR